MLEGFKYSLFASIISQFITQLLSLILHKDIKRLEALNSRKEIYKAIDQKYGLEKSYVNKLKRTFAKVSVIIRLLRLLNKVKEEKKLNDLNKDNKNTKIVSGINNSNNNNIKNINDFIVNLLNKIC